MVSIASTTVTEAPKPPAQPAVAGLGAVVLIGGTAMLAADGWDALSITEPSGDPAGWTVPQKLLWLVMRFMDKHTSDNFNGIRVYKADDTLATTQAVTEAGGVKTVGKVQ